MSRSFLCFSIYFFSSLFVIDSKATEDSLYSFSWLDKDKEVYVLQNRKYRKNKNVYISGGGGVTTSGAFVNAFSFQFKAGYFFKEDWGIEGLFSKNIGQENSIAKMVKNVGGASGSVPFRVFVKNYTGLQILWSPFYSKINTFNKIIYLDWMFSVGGVYVSESNNRKLSQSNDPADRSISDDSQDESDSHLGFLWGTGLQFYLSKDYYIKFDLTGTHFKTKTDANGTEEILYNNYDLVLGLGYIF
jgi:outer membrane beta-barrel protein